MKRILLIAVIVLCVWVPAHAQQIPVTFFGFTETNTSAGNYPTWGGFGMHRYWDSPPCQWPSINTAPGVFDFTTCLDRLLAQDYQNGVFQVIYDLWRTPTWASSHPTDTTSCHDNGSAPGQGPGECYPPINLNADGSGTNDKWNAWLVAIATHTNDKNYLNGTGPWAAGGASCPGTKACPHAHIQWWEPVNEPDGGCGGASQCFYFGSLAQLSRLTEDVNCTITGRGFVRGVKCTAVPIDPTAQVLMSPTHAKNQQALTYTQNELYCSKTQGIPSYQLPCPSVLNATANAIDIIIVHMKPGDETGNTCPAPTPCTVESAMAMYAANIRGVLQPNELKKPFWDGEASYAPMGFESPYTNANPGNQASFFPRFYMALWTQGITASAFYTSDEITSQSGTVGQNATAQAAKWLAGSTLSPCTSSGTVFSCSFTDKSGAAHLAMYDTSQLCTGSTCPTKPQAVATNWTTFQDMTAASSPASITGHSVAIGIKPSVLSGSNAGFPNPPTNLIARTL